MHILLVDDDITLSTMTCEYLESKHFQVTQRHQADMGLAAFTAGSFDLCILDVQMPGQNGFDLAINIRKRNELIPIIFLTGKVSKEDRIRGFEVGADDYITKPFSLEELYLRIKAIQRRLSPQNPSNITGEFTIGKYHFHPDTQSLYYDQSVIKLTTTESRLLALLCEKNGKPLKRHDALIQIWGDDDYFKGKSMNVFITHLRARLSRDPRIVILNLHGEGYKLVVRESGH